MITQAIESVTLAIVLKFTYSLMIRITRETISTGISTKTIRHTGGRIVGGHSGLELWIMQDLMHK